MISNGDPSSFPPVRKAVIPAAGFGTRLLPATKAIPKELLPVIDKPVLQYVVEEAVDSGITQLIVVVSKGKQAIADHLLDNGRLEAHLRAAGKEAALAKVRDVTGGATVRFVEQPEQRGLGDAVRCARDAVGGEPFAVMLGDTLIVPDAGQPAGLRQTLAVYERTGGSVVAVRRVPPALLSRYGIVDGRPVEGDQRTYRLRRLVEKPPPEAAPTDLAIAGRYVFTPDLFDDLEQLTPGHGGELQLTDAMNAMAQEKIMHAHLWRATRYDIGSRADYVRCIINLARMDPELSASLQPGGTGTAH